MDAFQQEGCSKTFEFSVNIYTDVFIEFFHEHKELQKIMMGRIGMQNKK